jgi:hypothetical protein
MQNLHIADGPPDKSGGAPPKPTMEAITAENAALKSRLAVYEAREKQQLADETLISEKMRAGLRRNQAIAVIKRQRDFAASEYGKMVKARHEERQAKANAGKSAAK